MTTKDTKEDQNIQRNDGAATPSAPTTTSPTTATSPEKTKTTNDSSTTTPEPTPADVDVSVSSPQTPAKTTTTTTTTPRSNSGGGGRRAASSSDRVKVHFVAVGNAPIMRKTKFQIGADQSFAEVQVNLSKMLRNTAATNSPLFLYCNAAFVPSPEERLGDLRDCFAVRGELVIHYSLQEAWG